jgi:hypothetical protein
MLGKGLGAKSKKMSKKQKPLNQKQPDPLVWKGVSIIDV